MWTGLARDRGDARTERACLWRRAVSSASQFGGPFCWGLQRDDCPSDPPPEGLAIKIATFEHQVGALRRHKSRHQDRAAGRTDLPRAIRRDRRSTVSTRWRLRKFTGKIQQYHSNPWPRRAHPTASTDRNTDLARSSARPTHLVIRADHTLVRSHSTSDNFSASGTSRNQHRGRPKSPGLHV